MQQITAFRYFKDSFIYFFSRKKFIGKYYFIRGKKRKIIAETCYNVFFEGIPDSYPKAFLKTLNRPAPKWEDSLTTPLQRAGAKRTKE